MICPVLLDFAWQDMLIASTLNIVGYQYPHPPHERYDSDWLDIEIRVIDRQGDWSSTDPIMLYLDPFRGGFMATMKNQESLLYPCQVYGSSLAKTTESGVEPT